MAPTIFKLTLLMLLYCLTAVELTPSTSPPQTQHDSSDGDVDYNFEDDKVDPKSEKTGKMMRGAARQMYGSATIRKQQRHGSNGQRTMSPSSKHPEEHLLLPNMFNLNLPIVYHNVGAVVPYLKNPYYSGIPLPVYFPNYNPNLQVPATSIDGKKGTLVRSGMGAGPGLNGQGIIQYPSPRDFDFKNGRGELVRKGIYGDMTSEVGRTSVRVQDEDEDDIISGRISPCGGECAQDEFLCVGSCMCIPTSYRCDGKPDCSGMQDELECGEEELDSMQECLEADNNIRCPRSGKCIKKIWLCDGEDDCGDFSDETHCDGQNCTEEQFECNNGFCVHKSWLCDGDNDCKDYSDEINCTKKSSCTGHDFLCGDGNCISYSWRCDMDHDCIDGSDEANCPQEPLICTDSQFECGYPKCVRKEFKCDGDDDCGDWSDEENCPQTPTSCGPDEFKCAGGKCIPDRWRCDEEVDCDDGEDEQSCGEKKTPTCGPDEMTCNNGNCILRTWSCDGVNDCPAGEDEDNCLKSCEVSQFNCIAHHGSNDTSYVTHKSKPKINCISQKHVCDGKKDCPNGADERNCPKKKKCEPGSQCQQYCVTLYNGEDSCSCGSGFMLGSDKHTCHDVDECKFESEPVCSQTCTNTIGSFSCSCIKGYTLRPDGRSCKANGEPPTLIFANRVDIRQVSLNSMKYTAIMKGLQNAIALDYHYKEGWIFWSDVSLDIIRKSRLNGSDKSDVIRWGLESPGGVAADWIHNLLYWTDSGTRRVEVTTLDGMLRSVIASNDLDKPRAIVVHPGEAVLFWTDWGPKPKIERAELDGSNRISIVTESVFWPNGLALDYVSSKLYWADAKHHVIESANLDGSERKKVITKGLPHPFAITLFEDSVYWTDWHTKSISTANKETGMGYRVVHAELHFPMDIHSFHYQRQPNYTNHCGDNNGGCSHLCLPNSKSYRCVCPLGLMLLNNGKTCATTPEKLLIFARKKDIRLRQLTVGSEMGNIDMVIPLDGVQYAVALDFDSDEDMIYWTDVDSKAISRSYLNGSRQEIIVTTNLDAPNGLAVDWVTRKIYWTDEIENKIEVSNLNGTMRCLLVWDGLDRPRDIIVDPLAGFMYWSSWGTEPKIERAGMDGTSRRTLVSFNLTQPNGLAIDHEKGRLYWVDSGTHRIEYSKLDGTSRYILLDKDVGEPFGLSMYGSRLYWTDWATASIDSVDKITGRNRTVVRNSITGLMDVRVYHRERQAVPTMCHANNGGCSHLCLLAPTPTGYSCSCPIGINLMEDKLTCSFGPTNSLLFAHRVDIRQISLDVPYIADVVLPLPPMKNTISVDVDRKTGDLYWSDTAEDVIQRSTEDNIVEDVVVDGLETANGMVVDSTGRKIYWTDEGRNSIEVCELDGRHRKLLISTNLDSPRAITLHYHHGLMFWSDWGHNPKIEQADMDGQNRKTIISENLIWPNGLAIDRPAGRLYWTDGKEQVIESSDLQGKDRRVVLNKVPHPYGLVIVGNHMYWTDWKTSAIHRADKMNGTNNKKIRENLIGLMEIRSVQVENIAENACGKNNGGCSHLCLRTPGGFNCACPTGILLQEDGKNCNSLPTKYLLFATRDKLARMSLDTPELWDVSLPINGIQNAVAVDFHWNKQIIYFTDVHLDVIRSVSMNNMSNVKTIVNNLDAPDGLGVDWLAENIYWTDTGRKVLEVAKLDGSCRKVVVHEGLSEPRALTLFPRKGYLYWADWGGTPCIERSMLDGSRRRPIITSDLGFPNGLAIDYDNKKFFWADALKDRIETSDLSGRNRAQLVPDATHPFGLTVFGEYIYWTDWYSKSIERANRTTGKDRMTIKADQEGIMEIRAVAASKQMGWSPCQVNNGGCSHLCLFRQTSYVCACPDIPDARHCSTEPSMVVPSKKDVEDDDSVNGVDGEGTRSDLDRIHGDPNMDLPNNESELPAPPRSDLLAFALLVMLGLIVLLVISTGCYCYTNSAQRKKYMYSSGTNTLAFSNPNYTASSAESAAAASGGGDKKAFLWKKFKYDKSQERVYDVQDEVTQSSVTEGISLMEGRPPTPPLRNDSITIKVH